VIATLCLFVAEMIILPREALLDLLGCWIALALVARLAGSTTIAGWLRAGGSWHTAWLRRSCSAEWQARSIRRERAGRRAGDRLRDHSRRDLVSLVWSINLHNFMDGIDGLLGWQALFVFLMLAALMAAAARCRCLAPVRACSRSRGFHPVQFSARAGVHGRRRQRSAGLLIGYRVLRQLTVSEVEPFSGLIACSAFAVDASCNSCRACCGESAGIVRIANTLPVDGSGRHVACARGRLVHGLEPFHRRSGHLAAESVVVDAAAGRPAIVRGLEWMAAIYGLGVALWIFGKRWCLRRARTRHADATA
jgi:hypothetical protein